VHVLVVDDQRSARRLILSHLESDAAIFVHEAETDQEARRILTQSPIEIAFIDLRLSATDPQNRDGLVFLRHLRATTTARAIVVSGYDDMPEIREAMRAGAHDYLLKSDICNELIEPIIETYRVRHRLEHEALARRTRVAEAEVTGMIGSSAAMERLRNQIGRVALSDRPVLVTGPSGTGKELAVRAIHRLGLFPDQPLVDINCGAIPENLIEAQLFGYEKGAFTGAAARTNGYLATVEQGTLFLDEIGELALPLQTKLLRVLETRRFRRVGSTSEELFSGRVIAATHAALHERVQAHTFREDLFHRLDVLRLAVPALSERREDIPALVHHFAQNLQRPLHFTSEAIASLRAAEWPGNVRQLRNLIDRVAVFCDEETISAATVREFLAPEGVPDLQSLRSLATRLLKTLPDTNKLELVQSALIHQALELTHGNKSAAARLLGVHRKLVERAVPLVDPTSFEWRTRDR
jgi:DNA-binding NtrC family response regulator